MLHAPKQADKCIVVTNLEHAIWNTLLADQAMNNQGVEPREQYKASAEDRTLSGKKP